MTPLQGVLNAAALLVDLIKEYFPLTIDKLDREKALFAGELYMSCTGRRRCLQVR